MNIIGISAFYHDSAAALVRDGEIVAAAQEERFTRKKHDAAFPIHAMKYCLEEAGVSGSDIDAVVFYDKPIMKFARILQTYFSTAPLGLRSFMMAMPLWLKQKLWIPMEIEKALEQCGANEEIPIFFSEHHESHAASAFFPSPFESAAILTLDGVGEWATASIAHGQGNQVEMRQEIHFPHSLGLLYSAFTYFCGFKVNSGEYKLMGLAPYGQPKYVQKIYDHLIDVKPDGSFKLNLKFFDYMSGLKMTNNQFAKLFDGPPRKAESAISQREMDLASSIQVVTEEIVAKMARHAKALTGEKNLCLAGGVALNCVSNGKLLKSEIFDNIWIQPAAGDAGGALGAALLYWYQISGHDRTVNPDQDAMHGTYLGPMTSNADIKTFLDKNGYPYENLSGEDRHKHIAKLIAEQNVIGLCQGRMEFGPRALGNRSIIGDARSEKMQSVMNLKIKYRESFRPFAPSCLREDVSTYFEMEAESPYMLLVAPVKQERCIQTEEGDDMRKRIHQKRSDIPAITHVDYSARVQTVSPDTNPEFYGIIAAFKKETGYGIVINTSFNVRGEPIVCTPEDAYRCFMRTEMDFLVLNDFILSKKEQPEWHEKSDWRNDFTLD